MEDGPNLYILIIHSQDIWAFDFVLPVGSAPTEKVNSQHLCLEF